MDPSPIDRLRALGGEELVRQMALVFAEDAPLRLAAIRAGVAHGNTDAVRSAAHALKGTAGSVGAGRLLELCLGLERQARDGVMPPARAVEALAAEIGRVGRQLSDGPDAAPVPLIFVVEDNPANRLLVRALLRHRFRLSEHADGASALEAMLQERPDCVLLDIGLPIMDGLEVLRRIRVQPELRAIPAIALTAHAMRGDRERFLAAGFDDYLAKPLADEAELVGAIERMLAHA